MRPPGRICAGRAGSQENLRGALQASLRARPPGRYRQQLARLRTLAPQPPSQRFDREVGAGGPAGVKGVDDAALGAMQADAEAVIHGQQVAPSWTKRTRSARLKPAVAACFAVNAGGSSKSLMSIAVGERATPRHLHCLHGPLQTPLSVKVRAEW